MAKGEKIESATARRMMEKAAVRGQVSTYISVIFIPQELRMFIAVAPEPGASATDGEWVEVKWNDIFGLGDDSMKRSRYWDFWKTKPEVLREQGVPVGSCGFCDKPGHTSHHPGPVPYTGTWCDRCYRILAWTWTGMAGN